MDTIILGLLLLQSRTVYQLQTRINQGLHLMYSGSMGSIQAAIKKLLHHGYIQYEEMVEHGKFKKLYSITDTGKEYFLQWVNTPMTAQSFKNPELTKLYFMGFSDKTIRIENMQHYIEQLHIQYQSLQFIYEESLLVPIPEEAKEIGAYQLLSAKYGMDFMKFNIDWYSNLLEKIKKE